MSFWKKAYYFVAKRNSSKDEIICRPLNLEAYEWDKNDELNSQYNLLIKRINKPFNVYKMVLEVKNISFLLFTDHNNEKFISYGKNIHDSLLYGFLELISRFQLAYEDEYKKYPPSRMNIYIMLTERIILELYTIYLN
ncbi:hypothetical protein HWH77_13705 [Bacillus velezensis]|uniref:hypothetical protein n=1 Tax=Bacillus velezensis TaxID=492670 RepID=UPI00188439CA|nr:hypothetical protein [Bacillus velezensis]QOX76140.1 hypothetical protein HWH77_13705 [Bacillus velezensis]